MGSWTQGHLSSWPQVLFGSRAHGLLGSWALYGSSWALGLLSVEPGNDVAKRSLSKKNLTKKLKNARAFFNFMDSEGEGRGRLLGSWALGLKGT
jgi:hypothetical protein